jgi:hypothetical protein
MSLSPSEGQMWVTPVSEPKQTSTDEEINSKYSKRELRIVTESNREQLPNFVEALKRPSWMNLRPFYQRRPRWDKERQSKLIESFIMNIPVPPLFVYESDLAKYEVMDGQQRITAILDFYTNRFSLAGLEQWPELNGRIYDDLPSEIRKGIDRRSISYIVLLKESATTSEEEGLLRQQVFERLNTGGVKLGKQEIRNSIYHGKFNDMLLDLAKYPTFRTIWQLQQYTKEEEDRPPEALQKNSFYVQMRDVEVILRFFALRHAEHYRGGMQDFMSRYMIRARKFPQDDLDFLRELFTRTLDLSYDIYQEHTFHSWESDQWSSRPQVAFADAVMVGLSRCLQHSQNLVERAEAVRQGTQNLFAENSKGTFTGQKNTKGDVQTRIGLFERMIARIIQG